MPKLRHPQDHKANVSFDGVEYKPNHDGQIEVPDEAVPHLVAHGYLTVDPEAEIALRNMTGVDDGERIDPRHEVQKEQVGNPEIDQSKALDARNILGKDGAGEHLGRDEFPNAENKLVAPLLNKDRPRGDSPKNHAANIAAVNKDPSQVSEETMKKDEELKEKQAADAKKADDKENARQEEKTDAENKKLDEAADRLAARLEERNSDKSDDAKQDKKKSK